MSTYAGIYAPSQDNLHVVDSHIFKIFSTGATKISENHPDARDVRKNTTYGYLDTMTGTLEITGGGSSEPTEFWS